MMIARERFHIQVLKAHFYFRYIKIAFQTLELPFSRMHYLINFYYIDFRAKVNKIILSRKQDVGD